MPLSVGANVITIKVTAEDLAATETYTLTVTRAATNASDDARLSALMVNGQPVDVSGFVGVASDSSDGAADYAAGFPNAVSSIAISATPNHPGAMVVIETGGALADLSTLWTVDADGMVDLVIRTVGNDVTGVNNILIEVTAEDGATVNNYFVVITRALASASSDAKLTDLTLSGITFSPAFSGNTMIYSADVPVNIAATTVTAIADGTEDPAVPATSVVIKSDKDDTLGKDLPVLVG